MLQKWKIMPKKYKILCVVLAVVLVAVCATAIPYRGESREDLIGTQRHEKIAEYIKEHKGIRQAGRDCPAYDDAYALISMDFEPYMANVVSMARLGVYGTLGQKEYVYYHWQGETMQTYTAADPAELPKVSAVRYSLRVERTFIGSLGWQRTIQVEVPTEMTQVLDDHRQVVLLLTGQKGVYAPLYCEHGVFTVDSNKKVTALSYMSCAMQYDGKSVNKLIGAMQKMRRAMGLWG